MKQTQVFLIAIALLLMTAHRLPAPIQEIPEAPSPTPVPVAPPAQPQASPQSPPPAPQPESNKAPPRTKGKKAVSENPAPAPKAPSQTSPKDGTAVPKGAVHLVIHNDSDARKIFNYFRWPDIVAKPETTGLYRIEVSPDGTVAAVTILKSMGPTQDVLYMKAFVTWRANPGALRLVDVPRHIFTYSHVKHIQ